MPSPLEFHPDHRAACFLLCDAVSGIDVHFQVAFYELGQPVCANTLVDITPVLDRKNCAISCYQSQLNEQPYGDIVMGLNRYRSMTLPEDVTHAEGFSQWPSDLIQKIGPLSIPFHQIHRLAPDSEESGPLVSIIIRTKDRPNLLANAMRSITTQTYANLEMVVINDGGKDVQDVVQSLSGDMPFQYVDHATCRGRALAANSGLKAARGKYCNFLDDDDVFYPDHVMCLINRLEMGQEKVAYSNVLNVFFKGPPENPQNREKEELVFNFDFDPDRLLFENYIPIMSVLFSRETLASVKGFSEDLTLFEDWDFWMRLSRHFSFRHVDRTTAEYRFYGTSGMAAAHRVKYHYDQALATLFDRTRPLMDGRAWAAFRRNAETQSEQPEIERDRHHCENNICPSPKAAPLVSDAVVRPPQPMETQGMEKPAVRIRRKMGGLFSKARGFWRQRGEKGVDRSKPPC
ncbi:MAG: glycosyltransferase [Deltaproteobacteria bacterium]|nr:glycosyltransferase [Deltaproteobacteria bacterium]